MWLAISYTIFVYPLYRVITCNLKRGNNCCFQFFIYLNLGAKLLSVSFAFEFSFHLNGFTISQAHIKRFCCLQLTLAPFCGVLGQQAHYFQSGALAAEPTIHCVYFRVLGNCYLPVVGGRSIWCHFEPGLVFFVIVIFSQLRDHLLGLKK